MRGAIAFLVLAFVAGVTPLRADGVWSALVLAANENPPSPVPAELEPYATELRSIFGFNSFYLMGAGAKKIRKGGEEWIVPTRKVFMKIRCLDRNDGRYRLQIELYVKKRMVANSEVKLSPGTPLYVRGPGYGRGRLVFILAAR
jgi:hypothetical protein